VLTIPRHKTGFVTNHKHVPRTWTETLVRPKQWKGDMRLGTSIVKSLCRAVSLTAVVRELARCKLDLVGVQEVRWDRGAR